MYTCCTLPLHSVLPLRMRSILSVKLRQIPGVAAASSDEQKLTIYYQGKVDLRVIRMLVRSFEQKYGKAKEDKKEWDVAAYRREAMISVGGFIAKRIRNFMTAFSCSGACLPYSLPGGLSRTALWALSGTNRLMPIR